MLQIDMQLSRHGREGTAKKNYANRHHEQLIIAITICNKTLLVSDLVKIRKTGAGTDIILLYK